MPDKKLKVGLVSPFLPRKDGIAIYSNNLITHMDMKGIKIIKIGDSGSNADYRVNLKSFRLKEQLKKIIKKENLDLLHIQYVPTLFGKRTLNISLLRALKQNIPVITTLHEVHYESNNIRESVLSWIQSEIVKRSKKTIVHTPQQKDFIKKAYKKDTVCIYHGLNLFKANKKKNNNILFFGYITPLKGIEYLIKAMRSLPDYNLTIAGHIPNGISKDYKNQLKQLIKTKNIRLDIRWIPEKEKMDYFKNSSLVVLPYLWAPYQSGILHNAMSFGIPVIVTRTGSLHEVVELFNVGKIADKHELAKAIKEVFKKYKTFKSNTEKYRKAANWKEIAKQHKEMYSVLEKIYK